MAQHTLLRQSNSSQVGQVGVPFGKTNQPKLVAPRKFPNF
jgi:hypothetical protein